MPAPRRQLALAPAGALLAALLAALLLTACGGESDSGPPAELSKKDSATLTDARRRLDAAIETEGRLSASPQAARKIQGKVQAIVSEGVFESEQLDEFGLAALGRLGLVAPSLVEMDSDGVPEALDAEATRAFLRFAGRDSARALLVPAERTVETIERTVERSGAGPGTRIGAARGKAAPGLRVARYLREAEAATVPVWPGLSERLGKVREGL
ncbi:MAG: hypothetical protein M3356_06730 [Actinomycetota bacterium]|nr:hypothetical protein [Actinomycetota bacterium]